MKLWNDAKQIFPGVQVFLSGHTAMLGMRLRSKKLFLISALWTDHLQDRVDFIKSPGAMGSSIKILLPELIWDLFMVSQPSKKKQLLKSLEMHIGPISGLQIITVVFDT